MFFSQRVIFVKGPSETAIYSYLMTRGIIEPPIRGLAVIDCMGKYNIHRFVAVLVAFGIDHSVLYDGDNGGSHDADVKAEINRVRTGFTKRITQFPGDSESELGLKPLSRNQSSRKPQYVLYHLESKLIDQAKLESIKQKFVDLATAQ